MAYIVKMPKMGLEMERGTLVEWHVGEGDAVEEGDLLAEIESEKSVGEVEAREDGVLRRVFVGEGETVPPGSPIAILAGGDEDIADLEAEVEAEGVEPAPEAGAEATGTTPGETTTPQRTGTASAGGTDVKASPRATRRAEELGVDLGAVEGTGPGGAITEDDVEAAAGTPTEDRRGAPRTLREERAFGAMRRTIAERLGESYRTAVHVTEHRTANAEALLEATDAADDAFDADVSMTDVLLVALSATFDEHPAFNATFEDDTHRLYEEHNVGLAVDIEAGLIAPVLPDVGGKTIEELAHERHRLTERALSGDYTMDDLAGGTFTVTNLGVLGVESFDPVINPPQVAILGVNAVSHRAVPDDGGVAFRRHLPLDLSFDHRVVDGADAARFLETLVGNIEEPWRLLPDEVAGQRDAVANGGGAVGTLPGREVTARATGTGTGGTVTAGSHEWSYDDASDPDESASAPSPVDMFLGSLAACLSESVRYQADKRGVALRSIEVDAAAEPERGTVESVDVSVSLGADDSVDQQTLARLVEVAEQGCYVSRLLRDDLPVDVSWSRA